MQPGGLSPRVRGSPAFESSAQTASGSIPACAGEPPTRHCLISSRRAYPRVCGGAWTRLALAWCLPGLSPRVRGSRSACECDNLVGGSIPACAGEPFECLRLVVDIGVYPRVCGGADLALGADDVGLGLSPRVRGSRQLKCRIGAGLGSIPACAGEPATARAPRPSCRVYPRVCGGARARAGGRRAVQGLSPRVRGSPRCGGGVAVEPGSIPACAGEPL